MRKRSCAHGGIGRGRGIRTLDIQLPKLALYQAELYPDALPTNPARRHEDTRNTRSAIHLRQCDAPLAAVCETLEHPPNKKGAAAPFLEAGAPGEIRTPDHQVRSLVLYPTELRARGSTRYTVPSLEWSPFGLLPHPPRSHAMPFTATRLRSRLDQLSYGRVVQLVTRFRPWSGLRSASCLTLAARTRCPSRHRVRARVSTN